MTRQEHALELFTSGKNCAQSVAAAFCDDTKISQCDMFKMASAFGGGFARTRGQCGAVSAIGMVLGQLYFNGEDTSAANGKVYDLTRAAIDKFVSKNGSMVCGELLKNIENLTSGGHPDARTTEYYRVRPCAKLVMDAVGVIEEIIASNKKA